MTRPYALLRAGFPFVRTLGVRPETDYPIDVALGAEGRVYVLRCSPMSGRGEIVKLSWDEEQPFPLDILGGQGTEDGKFMRPVMLVSDGDEDLFVTDDVLHQVTILSKEGKFLGKWGKYGDGDGQLNGPSGIAFDADENVYIVDTLNHRVQKFTKGGKFLLKWGSYGDEDGTFNMPWGITVDELGDVYVVDWRNDRIQKFTTDGQFVFKFGKSGAGNGEFNRPSGVAVDSDGDIYVADASNDRVQLFNAEGRYVEQFIGDAILNKMARDVLLINAASLRARDNACVEPQKRLRYPKSVRVDDQGRMYVVDNLSSRVQVYQKDAIPLGEDQIVPPQTT